MITLAFIGLKYIENGCTKKPRLLELKLPHNNNTEGEFFTLHLYNDNNITDKQESILVDNTKKGNERPWREKKMANVAYYELLHILDFKKMERVKACAEILEYKMDKQTLEKYLFKVWFCKSPLCPMCNWRKTMKHGIQSQKIIAEVMKRKPTCRWLFLTLSVKNVYDGEDLSQSLKDMTQGFRRLMQYKKIKQNLIGFMRATEVTVNNTDNSYNQHMHVLLCVEPMYFKNTENYVNQKQWMAFWKKAMKLDYDPVAHIQIVRPKNKHKSDMESVVAETVKYPVKDTDYRTHDQQKNLQRVADLEQGLYKKRLISYGGLLKEIHKELNLDDVEDGDLVHVDDDEKEIHENAYSVVAYWNWERENYFIKNI